MSNDSDADYEMMMQALAGEYLDESADILEEIQLCIENIDKKIGNVEENLLLIKRGIHSIKGGGTPFGFPTISMVCHGLEDYLETTSDLKNVSINDIGIFLDGINSILQDRIDPDEQGKEMLLKSLPSGRLQSGQTAVTKGVGLLIMPKGLQRKIIGQELSQLGFKITLVADPILAIETALVLNPDFIIANMINDKLSGIELSNMFHAASALQKTPFAIFTSSDVEVLENCPTSTTFIRKGPAFAQKMLNFVNFP